jgi:quercetin dioxygenase-like cupin family protein
MKFCLVAVRGRWSVSATTCMLPLACLAMVLTMLSAWSTVVAAEKQGFIVLPNGAPRFSVPVGGGMTTAEILATREQTGGVAGVWRYTSVHGGGPPLHIHRTEDEFFYVLSGEFNFQLGDCIKSAPAGSFVFIPKDEVHTFQHVGPEPGVLLGVVTPGGFEGLFQALQDADAETAEAHVKKNGMEVVGPAIEAATLDPRPTPPRTAQRPAKVYRIGVLSPGCPPPSPTLDTFLQGLRDLGYHVRIRGVRPRWGPHGLRAEAD